MKRAKSSRQSQILAELDSSPSLRVAELARRLDVSTETIRRDLDELTDQVAALTAEKAALTEQAAALQAKVDELTAAAGAATSP